MNTEHGVQQTCIHLKLSTRIYVFTFMYLTHKHFHARKFPDLQLKWIWLKAN